LKTVADLDLEKIEHNIYRGSTPSRLAACIWWPGDCAGAGRRDDGRLRIEQFILCTPISFCRDPQSRLSTRLIAFAMERALRRRCTAIQHGCAPFALSASFQIANPG
jgi:hypothetical protein